MTLPMKTTVRVNGSHLKMSAYTNPKLSTYYPTTIPKLKVGSPQKKKP
jgi:hypothetical protein